VTFVAHDERFDEVVGSAPLLLQVAEVSAHEGPVYAPEEDALYFTTVPRRDSRGVPRVAIRRLQLDGLRFPLSPARIGTVRADANVANGMFLDRDGSLVVCEQGTFETPARITRVDPSTGTAETIVDALGGFSLNSPNDVVVRSDGTIWFTDPSYGHRQGFRPEPELCDLVHWYDPASGRSTVAADSFDKPNGLAFSPDERVLYVADNGKPHHLVAYDVRPNGSLHRRRVVAVGTREHPDGVKVDTEGRIYISAVGGIQVFDRSGALLGEISLPGAVNFTFGGPDRNVLFITADTAIWAAVLNAKGASPWHSSEPGVSSTTPEPMPSPRQQPRMPVIAEAVSSSPS
jgi:gluconolactonase